MHIPSSTYRVQLHKDFNFKDLEGIIDYIFDLGITTIYAAPIFTATPGSTHGYDVIDPHSINPEIGTLPEFRQLIAKLKAKNMSWVQDIVPNHMAFHVGNFRLMDVLERGRNSEFADYFDILWDHHSPKLNGKIQVPFLGKSLEDCVHDGEIKISFSDVGLTVDYFRTSYPLSTSVFAEVVTDDELSRLDVSGSYSQWLEVKKSWIHKIASNEETLNRLLIRLDEINKDKVRLSQLLAKQFYQLTFWKDSEREIGYRRFFTVNELICLRMEDENVFNDYHAFIHSLYREGLINGLRVDHIDGLQDPAIYLKRLRVLFGDDCYIIAEKILEAKETMPRSWPLEGTSGYEFLSFSSQLITNRNGAKRLASFYKELVPSLPSYHALVSQNKRMILEKYMAGEWSNLNVLFRRLGLLGDHQPEKIKEALAAFMIALPVYRIYPEAIPLEGDDLKLVSEAFAKAMKAHPEIMNELNYLKGLFCNVEAGANAQAVLLFVKRLMQFTGPLTAKGVEDTTFYVYNVLISHDEVGDAPTSLGISINEFHKKMQLRQSLTPYSLNATATHDTKRGEDSRLRLNALTDFPERWIDLVTQWMRSNQKFHKRTSKGLIAPVVNDEYFIYQSIVGGLPANLEIDNEFIKRVETYQTKVLREAKMHSDWAAPDEEYEQACISFIRQILQPDSEFFKTLIPFMREIAALANRYSLAQSLFKITCPGIPDTYQGAGLWDLSFVDPDNRRPVDYAKRIEFLSDIERKEKESDSVLFSYLEDHRSDGIEKLFVTFKTLNFRKAHRQLFVDGDYIPLQQTGKDMVTVSYARHHNNQWALMVVPLRAKTSIPTEDLLDHDEIILPAAAPKLWKNIFTGEEYNLSGRLSVGECCRKFPVALLTNI